MYPNLRRRDIDAEILGLTTGLVALSMSLGKHMKENPDQIPEFCRCLHPKQSGVNVRRAIMPPIRNSRPSGLNVSQTRSPRRTPKMPRVLGPSITAKQYFDPQGPPTTSSVS